MVAPDIKNRIFNLRDGKITVNDETTVIIEKVFEELHKIEPCGDDERRDIWLQADRGTIEDFGDYEELREWGEVETYEEFENWWKDSYPTEKVWYHMVTVEREGYRAIFLGRQLVYQSEVHEYEILDYKADLTDFFGWMHEAVKKVVEDLETGIYNSDVENNLLATERTGIIKRKDLWDIFPDDRTGYFEEISQAEIDEFVAFVAEQTDREPVGEYVTDMTAGKFFECCKLGYVENHYEKADELTAKELYYKYADGRDEGLSEVTEDSPEEFAHWFHDRHRGGGHPWEVCRGGNSTHVALHVAHDEKGYYLYLAGKAWSRSIETIKFYLALRRIGIAVYLADSKGITDRLLEKDLIGIVPSGVIPVYCESHFPGYKILDFMHLPYENVEEVLKKVTWLKEQEVFLKKI